MQFYCVLPWGITHPVLSQSVMSDSAAQRTGAHQAPLSMAFPRQEHWSGLPFPAPGDLPNLGTGPASLVSLALAGGFLTTSATWEALGASWCHINLNVRAQTNLNLSYLWQCILVAEEWEMQLNFSFILPRTWYMALGIHGRTRKASAFIWSITLPSPNYDITRPKHKLNKRYMCTLNLLFYSQQSCASGVCHTLTPYYLAWYLGRLKSILVVGLLFIASTSTTTVKTQTRRTFLVLCLGNHFWPHIPFPTPATINHCLSYIILSSWESYICGAIQYVSVLLVIYVCIKI